MTSRPCWAASIEPLAILEVATVVELLRIGLTKVSRPRWCVGCSPLAFNRRGTVVAGGKFYGALVDVMTGTHHSPPLGGKKQVGLPSKANITVSPVAECSSHQITSGGTSVHWPS